MHAPLLDFRRQRRLVLREGLANALTGVFQSDILVQATRSPLVQLAIQPASVEHIVTPDSLPRGSPWTHAMLLGIARRPLTSRTPA